MLLTFSYYFFESNRLVRFKKKLKKQLSYFSIYFTLESNFTCERIGMERSKLAVHIFFPQSYTIYTGAQQHDISRPFDFIGMGSEIKNSYFDHIIHIHVKPYWPSQNWPGPTKNDPAQPSSNLKAYF